MGIANLEKAKGFQQQQNWAQALRYGEIAATKLKQLKDRRLETVIDINDALTCKFNALNFMARHKEAKECAEERYTLWAMNQMRNPGSISSALALIQCCMHNEEFEDAENYARHAMFMINEMTDNYIPAERRSRFLADGSYYLAMAVLHLARTGGIPSEEKKKAGDEAIASARQALKIHSQLEGTESARAAHDMTALADVLDYFNNKDDDEVLRLHEQGILIFRREQCNCPNVATSEDNLGTAYINRANRAKAVNDLDRYMANLEMALPHLREAVRIYQVNNHVDSAEMNLRIVAQVEKRIQAIRSEQAAAVAAAAAAAAATRDE